MRVGQVEVLVDRTRRLHRQPDASREVTAIRVVTHLAAVAQDVNGVLAFEHLLTQVRHHMAHRELDVAAPDVMVAERAPLADADAVERPHDRVGEAVLLVGAAGKELGGELLKSISRSLRRAATAASNVAAEMRSFSASRSYANSWKYEMPPIIAAAATTWSQSMASLVSSLASFASPSTRWYRGSSSWPRRTGPYLLKLSTPTTSCPACSRSATR